MRVELTELVWLDEHRELTLAELADLSGLSEAELHELEACGAIAPLDPSAATRTFGAECIVAARTAFRLRHDFELDAQGLAVALALLDRVRSLEAELRDLRAQLPRRIG
ncbi:MAG TPA: chaperone modulator CbpM [Casimicrobiaceae bacterium]